MAITVAGTTITFNDGTTQSTAGGTVNTTNVLNATAGGSYGGVGTYTIAYYINATTASTTNTTVAGSNLYFAYTSGCYTNWASRGLSGTWKNMGSASALSPTTTNTLGTCVWLRIS